MSRATPENSNNKKALLLFKAIVPVLVWLLASIVIVLIFIWRDQRFDSKRGWIPYGIVDSFERWPGILIGILGTVAVAVTIYILQSKIQENFTRVIEGLQTPLSNFDDIRRKAFELLQFSGTDDGAKFYMIAASPVFGIELQENERVEWSRVLTERIFSKCKVHILVFDWVCPEGSMESYLGRFCRSLYEYSRRQQEVEDASAVKLLTRCWCLLEEFLAFRETHPDFQIRRISDPPFGVILSSNRGESRALFYFESGMSLETELPTIGFATTDQHWVALAERAFRNAFQHSQEILDSRTDLEKKRDAILIADFASSGDVRRSEVGGYEIETDADVFPPNIGLGVPLLIQSVRATCEVLRKEVDEGGRLIGIDVGSGTGILAWVFAEYCDVVYATENWAPAYRNTERNLQNVAAARLRKGDLLADIYEKSEKDRVLVAFNHPYYPSPYNLFNTGPFDSGSTMLKRFFDQVLEKLPNTTHILMPFSSVAPEHSPRRIAEQRGFQVVTTNSTSDGTDLVFLITKDYGSPILSGLVWKPPPG